MNALARLLAEMDDDMAPESDGLPEAQIERLREVAARIESGCQFKIGDLVTIRKDAPVKGAGKPHVVINIDKDAPLYTGDGGNWPYAVRHDVTIISVIGGSIAPHSIPHWMLETYAA